MDLDRELARLVEQEDRLRLPRLDPGTPWLLGTRLKALAEGQGVAVAIEVRVARETHFFYAMPGTAPTNADWARRKRNSVELLHKSSYRIGRELQRDGGTLEDRMGLPTRDYASHGGSFPLRLEGAGCIGAVTISGLPERMDHNYVVEVLASCCGVALQDVALDTV